MDKRSFFFAALRDNAHLRKAWVLQAFSVVRARSGQPKPWQVRYRPEVTEVWTGSDWVALSDVEPMAPAIDCTEPLSLQPGEVPNLHRAVESTYGDVLFNWRVLVYAFDEHFEYQVGPISIKRIEEQIAERMVDDPEPGTPLQPEVLYVQRYLRYGQAIADLAGFTQLFVPAASPKALQTHPEARKRRAELLEQYKDRLHDPAVVAKLQDELVAMDKEWLKGDPSEGFFLNDKVWNTARKRMYLIHGPEAGFSEGTSAELIVNSLDEGWDITKLPTMVNSLRAGSYYRGALTALGGESVKFFMRIFQNTRISEHDCGTSLGLRLHVTKDNAKEQIGLYHVTAAGPELITAELLPSLMGKTIVRRSPGYCRTGLADYCEVCMGVQNSQNPMGMGSRATAVGSDFMYIMMKAAHAKQLKTTKVKLVSFLS